MNKTFSDDVKRDVGEAQNGFCLDIGCLEPIHSFHHKLPNNEANRKLFPLFIHSPFNCAGLCLNDHTNNSAKFTVTIQEAEIYEKFLRKLKGE